MAKYQIETDGGTYEVETDDGPETSAVGAAGRGAIDAIPFGTKGAAKAQELISGNAGSYDKYLSELDSLLAADKSQHPVAHYAGEIAGTAAPFAIPGVGAALGAESLAGRVGIGAGLGALQGASNNRNSEELPMDIAKGAGIGAVAQPIVGALGDVAGKAFSALTPSKNELVQEGLAGVTGATTRQLKALPGKNPEESMLQMADWLNSAKSPTGEPLLSVGDHVGDMMEKLAAVNKQAGNEIGATIKNMPMSAVPKDLVITAVQQTGKFATPDAVAQRDAVIKALNAAADQEGNIPFETLHNLKSEIGHEAYPRSGQQNPILADAYHKISDVQDILLDTYSGAPGINKPQFDQAKKTYAMTSKLLPLVKTGLAKELIQGSKVGSMLPAAGIGAITGSPLAGAGVAAGTILKPGIERIGKQAMFKAAMNLRTGSGIPGVMDKVAGEIAHNLPAAAASAASKNGSEPNLNHPAMQAALRGVTDPAQREKAIVANDYVLQQSDPSYAASKKSQ